MPRLDDRSALWVATPQPASSLPYRARFVYHFYRHFADKITVGASSPVNRHAAFVDSNRFVDTPTRLTNRIVRGILAPSCAAPFRAAFYEDRSSAPRPYSLSSFRLTTKRAACRRAWSKSIGLWRLSRTASKSSSLTTTAAMLRRRSPQSLRLRIRMPASCTNRVRARARR